MAKPLPNSNLNHLGQLLYCQDFYLSGFTGWKSSRHSRERYRRKHPAVSHTCTPRENQCLVVFHSEVNSKKTITVKRGKYKPQLSKSHLNDSLLPSQSYVLNTPEEKLLWGGWERSLYQTFRFPIPAPLSQK